MRIRKAQPETKSRLKRKSETGRCKFAPALSRFAPVSKTFPGRNAKKYTGYCIIACVPMWRTGWDSNPRYVAVRRFSRPLRYDRFGISPHLKRPFILAWCPCFVNTYLPFAWSRGVLPAGGYAHSLLSAPPVFFSKPCTQSDFR